MNIKRFISFNKYQGKNNRNWNIHLRGNKKYICISGCILGSKEVGVKFNKYLSMRTVLHQRYHTQTNTNQLPKYDFSSNPSPEIRKWSQPTSQYHYKKNIKQLFIARVKAKYILQRRQKRSILQAKPNSKNPTEREREKERPDCQENAPTTRNQ